jgi:hypothetical protein
VAPDTKLVLLFAGVHLIGLLLVTALLIMFLRSETVEPWRPPDEGEGGGGGNDRLGPRRPTDPGGGGIPLPDAVPARFRLRQPERIAGRYPPRERRRVIEPVRRPTPARR